MKEVCKLTFGVIIILASFQSANAQNWGRIQGFVYATQGASPVTDATVTLVGLNYSQRVDEAGQFIFQEVPAGSVLLRVESPQWGRNSQTVKVVPGETVEVNVRVLLHMYLEELVISAGPTALTRSELVNPVNVVTGNDLLESDGLSLGESLKNQPGITSTYFGPGASRPIIGGVGGSRVKILQNGLDIGDVSDQSEDHAVGADAFDAERIEIIRGPAALLYGSDITGGIVNVLDGVVPNERPVNRIEGSVMGRGGLGANERGGSGRLTGAFGNIVWRANGLLRETGDVSTPEFNPEPMHEEHHDDEDHDDEDHDDEDHGDEDHDDEDHEAPEMVDHLEKSSTSLGRGSFGMSWLGRRGYIGAAINFHNSDYGVPGHAHGAHGDEHEEHDEHEDDHEEEHEEHDEHGGGGVSIDLNSITYDVEGAYRFGDGTIEGLRFRVGIADYRHTELEHLESGADAVGLVYDNNQLEGRLELDHSLNSSTKGVAGIQMKRRDLKPTPAGDHASFLPATLSTQVGIFALERINLGSLRLELSGRMHWQSHDPDGRTPRSFSSLSLGGGANYEVSENLTFSLSLARAAKSPSTTELYADGVHTGIRSVDIGNENLEVEVTNNATFSSYIHSEWAHVTLTGYLNQSSNFIYHALTGALEEGIPVLQAAQSDARIAGLEIDADIELLRREHTHVILGLTGDYINGQLTSDEEYLPRIPPLRLRASLEYRVNNFMTSLSVKRVARQENVFSTEEETDGYTIIDAKVRYRRIIGSTTQSITLQGLNLGNTLARAHTSYLKETVPLPGRDIRLTYAIHF